MALIKCPECGKEISDKAKMCIGCGFPMDEYKPDQDDFSQQNIEINFDVDNYIKIEDGIMSVKTGKYKMDQAVDAVDNFVLDHCEVDEMTSQFTFLLFNQEKLYISGFYQTVVNQNGIENIKALIEFMVSRKRFVGRSAKQVKRFYLDEELNITNEKSKIQHGGRMFGHYKPIYTKKLTELIDNATLEYKREKEFFNGIYRYTKRNKVKERVYCPRCGSQNCQYFTTEKFVPGKTKTSYKANINPLKPFTLVNKKEKVIRSDTTVTEKQIICNDCGEIFS